MRIYLNNSSASGAYTITITKINEWQQFELPFINFGNPANLNYIAFNEFSGTATFPGKFTWMILVYTNSSDNNMQDTHQCLMLLNAMLKRGAAGDNVFSLIQHAAIQ